MKAFVTGGTGFIGSALIRALRARGVQVTALVRTPQGAQRFAADGVIPVLGDIRDRESMRAGMAGSDVVFHAAAWYKIGSKDWRLAEEINVEGTRNVLSLAHELGVGRIVYTSTLAVFSDTHGLVVDEESPAPGASFLTEYERTKWRAHFEVAAPLIQAGAPIILVMPGGVYGPGDRSIVGQLMEAFMRGVFPIFPSPQNGLSLAHVDDVAEGHILAAERGQVGAGYLLSGPALRMRQIIELWAEISGRPAPLLNLPPALVKPLAPLMGWVGQYVALPEMVSEESIRLVDATYWGSDRKARAELGWRPRTLVDGFQQTLVDLDRILPAPPPELVRRRFNAGAALSLAAGLGLLWALTRKRK